MAAMPLSPAELIETYIERNPHHPGRADVRLKDSCVPVWAIVGHWQATGRDAEYVARGYQVPRAAVDAALAYYYQHQALIEERLAENAPDD